jgi:hypothetical protein
LFAVKIAENIQQSLQLATTNFQLKVLLTFSNDPKENKTSTTGKEVAGQTSKQWLS